MPAPTRRRYINIKIFQLTPSGGSATQVNTIKSVEVSESTQMIQDGADDDKVASFQAEGMSSYTGSVDIADPVQRQALRGLATGTTTFNGTPEDGGTEVVVTIANAKYHSRRTGGRHSAVWTGGLSFSAYAPDGQTSPITEALAS